MLRNMNKLIIILTALLVATGCDFTTPGEYDRFKPSLVHAPDYTGVPEGLVFPSSVQVSSDFTAEELDGVLQSIDAWKVRTNGVVKLDVTIGNDPEAPCRIFPVDGLIPDAETALGFTRSGWSYTSCDIEISRQMIQEQQDAITSHRGKTRDMTTVMFQISMHEFGHVFGLAHVEEPSSIMFHSYSPKNVTLDDDALNAFCEHRGCPDGTAAL